MIPVNRAARGTASTRRAPGAEGRRTAANDVDRYLAALPDDVRATLEKLRRDIRAAAPDATEVISYQMPTFVWRGPLVAFAAFKDHCSLVPMSLAVMDALKDQLRAYDTGGIKATIRFPAGKPPPAALVKKLVRARMRENEARKHYQKAGIPSR